MTPSELVFTAVILLIVFVLLTMFELWVLKKLGFDVMGRLEMTYREGKTLKFFFQAFGAVAFIMAQPVLFAFLFSKISTDLGDILRSGVLMVLGEGPNL